MQIFIGSIAVSGYGSTENLERLSREIFQIEDGLAAERDEAITQYDRVFSGEGWGGGLGRRVIAESFFEDTPPPEVRSQRRFLVVDRDNLGEPTGFHYEDVHEDSSEALEPGFIQQRFGEQQ